MKIHVSISRDAKNQWRAWVPDLPGCVARGESQQDAIGKIDRAIRGYLASWDAPEPDHLEEEMVDATDREAELSMA